MDNTIKNIITEVHNIQSSENSFEQLEKLRVHIFAYIFTNYILNSIDDKKLYTWNKNYTKHVFNHLRNIKEGDIDDINAILEILENAERLTK